MHQAPILRSLLAEHTEQDALFDPNDSDAEEEDTRYDLLETVQNGVCAACSVQWLKNRRSIGKEALPDKSEARNMIDAAVVPQSAYLQNNTMSYEELLQEHGVQTRDVATPNLANDMPGVDQLRATIRNLMESDSKRTANHETGRSALISYEVTNQEGNGGEHVVAIMWHQGQYEFFDTNCGWYQIDPGCEDGFFRDYADAIENKCGFDISDVQITGVDA